MCDFTVAILPGAYASSVSLTLDMLAAAEKIAKQSDAAVPRWRVYSAEGRDIALGSHMHTNTGVHVSLRARPLSRYRSPDRSIWIVPGLGIDNYGAIAKRLAQPDALRLAKVLSTHARKGGSIAASCSAMFLLQIAGVFGG